MSKALSVDLRERVVAAIAAGSSCRAAAVRFEGERVERSPPSRTDAGGRGGRVGTAWRGQHSAQIDAHAALIFRLVDQKSDITLRELQAGVATAGVAAGMATLWRFFDPRRMTRKKVATQRNWTARTSWGDAGPGSRRSPISTRTVWRP